jgi:hypothetical protein
VCILTRKSFAVLNFPAKSRPGFGMSQFTFMIPAAQAGKSVRRTIYYQDS